jgi:hypothetical protein
VGFFRPVNTFALASVVGLILIFYGTFEIIQGVASRAVNPYWWVNLDHRDPAAAAGVLGVGVRPGVCAGPADGLDPVLGGLLRAVRGFSQIFMAFAVRHEGQEATAVDVAGRA